MRNLKKVLSLALALVMLLGMMVMGAGAAEYKDAASIGDDYKEAVGVVSAIKVMNGRTASSFQPEGTLTRAEAATIITRSLLGRSVADALAKNTESRFSDMQGHWAAGAVEYCYDRGIVRGTTTTTFSPDRTVKSVEYTAMVLRALGLVDADNAAGGNWQTEAIAVAAKNNLSDSVVVSSAPMKRQEAAQMSFNAITKYSPSGTSGYKVVDGDPATDVVFSTATEAALYMATQTTPGKLETAVSDDSLAKTVHNLTPGTKDDGFGHKIDTWNVDGKEVWAASTYTSTANIVIENQKEDAAKTIENKTLKDVNSTPFAASWDYIVDGETNPASKSGITTKAHVAALCADNNVVEIYLDSAKKISKIVVVNTYADQVTAVTPANEKKETNRSITVGGFKYETEDFEKGDVVLYTKSKKSGSFAVNSVVAAVPVEGEMTSFTNGNPIKYTIAGTAYELSTGTVVGAFDDTALKAITEGTYYLGTNGKIVYAVAADGTTTSGNYAVIISAHADLKDATWPATDKSVTLQVKALLADGTLGIYTVDGVKFTAGDSTPTDSKAELKIGSDTLELLATKTFGSEAVKNDSTLLTALNGVYDYTLDGNKIKLNKAFGQLAGNESQDAVVFAVAKTNDITKNSITLIGTGSSSDGTAIINNKTVFVVMSADEKTIKVVTGPAALESTTITAANAMALIDVKHPASGSNTLTAKIVFAKGTTFTPTVSETGKYAYLTGEYSKSAKKDAEGKYTYTYTGVSSDDEVVTLIEKTANETPEVVTAAGVYAIKDDGTVGAKYDHANGNSGNVQTVSAYADGVLVTDAKQYSVPENAKIVAAEDGAVLEAGARVFVVANATTGTQADIIFVLNAAEAEEEAAMQISTQPTAKTVSFTDGDDDSGNGGASAKFATATFDLDALDVDKAGTLTFVVGGKTCDVAITAEEVAAKGTTPLDEVIAGKLVTALNASKVTDEDAGDFTATATGSSITLTSENKKAVKSDTVKTALGTAYTVSVKAA